MYGFIDLQPLLPVHFITTLSGSLYNKYSRTGYLTASYNPMKQLTLAVTGTYTGSMFIEHHAGMIAQNVTVKTPDFWDMGIKAAYDFKLMY